MTLPRATSPLSFDVRAAPRGLLQTLECARGFGTFTRMLRDTRSSLLDEATEQEPVTVFAPPDEAFAKLPHEVFDLLESELLLMDVVHHHFVRGRLTVANTFPLHRTRSVRGEPLEMRYAGPRMLVDSVLASVIDVTCTNGVIHVVDGVLSPRYGLLDPGATHGERWRRFDAWLQSGAGGTTTSDGSRTLTVGRSRRVPH